MLAIGCEFVVLVDHLALLPLPHNAPVGIAVLDHQVNDPRVALKPGSATSDAAKSFGLGVVQAGPADGADQDALPALAGNRRGNWHLERPRLSAAAAPYPSLRGRSIALPRRYFELPVIDQKVDLVTGIMVVLCGEREVPTIVRTGTRGPTGWPGLQPPVRARRRSRQSGTGIAQ